MIRHRTLIAKRNGGRGFTLLELVITISVMMILVAVAVPAYQSIILRAKETVLRDTLFKMRDAIDKYTYDIGRAPRNLKDLVDRKYLRVVPVDPITNSDSTWREVQEDAPLTVGASPGIRDVFSGAEGVSADGTRYSDW
jgi:general secretion pathway protein G